MKTCFCYVGCSSGAPEPEALHVLACDPETGAVTTNLVEATAGTWGSPGSAAENKSAFFTGTGLVKTGKFGLLILVR